MIEPFVVMHYSEDERPTIKGNGFDGLEVGADREEAQAFVDFVNLHTSHKVCVKAIVRLAKEFDRRGLEGGRLILSLVGEIRGEKK